MKRSEKSGSILQAKLSRSFSSDSERLVDRTSQEVSSHTRRAFEIFAEIVARLYLDCNPELSEILHLLVPDDLL
ncbi:MAG: hypothetical protein J7641_07710 [Cyanobacteria bacterium SID2]|nr:hypothetical protein [Cyanobacteria bacterium SID2]